MASFAQRPIVEFHSLLLPPIRIHLRALSSLYRPQCLLSRQPAGRLPPCLAQRRSLTLYKTAKSRTTIGQHKILSFNVYQLPPPEDSEHLINIIKEDKTVVENISLQEAYDEHVQPGQILYLASEVPKKLADKIEILQRENWQLKARTYALLTAESMPHNIKPANSGRGPGKLRVTPLNLSGPEHFKLSLDRSYQFIKHGSPVEFAYRLTGKHVKDKLKRLMPSEDDSQLEWMLTHFPHLRPDFILKAMPEGSQYLVEPVSNGRRIQFVVAPPNRAGYPTLPTSDLTRRLLSVKRSVQYSIRKGLQGELPKVLRAKLADGGSTAYSPLTGRPLHLKRIEQRADNEEQQPTFRMMASPDRYMPLPKPTLVRRSDKLTASGRLDKPRYRYGFVRTSNWWEHILPGERVWRGRGQHRKK